MVEKEKDITERLHNLSCQLQAKDLCNLSVDVYVSPNLIDEAADEIERLRVRHNELHYELAKKGGEMASLKAQIERLVAVDGAK